MNQELQMASKGWKWPLANSQQTNRDYGNNHKVLNLADNLSELESGFIPTAS